MIYRKPRPKNELERLFLAQIEKETPEKIKNAKLIDLNNKDAFSFTLRKEHLKNFSIDGNGLGIESWFENYKKEAKVSTAGIRGLQNPLYPWDTRYPMNLLTIALATLGKVMVAKDTSGIKKKIAACETRYNSKEFVELIARVQAAYKVKTFLTKDYETMPIFLISFIIFMFDLYGGEYVTSSHALAKKIATKDLNSQGSQYIPQESLKFVEKVNEILDQVRKNGEYSINFASLKDNNIDSAFLQSIENGVRDYVEYLRKSVATNYNIGLIKKSKNKVVIECVGGSIYKTLNPILKELDIAKHFNFLNTKEDPFHHGVGKKFLKKDKFFDWGCDTTIMLADIKTSEIKLPVIETMNYEKKLIKFPLGTTVLITDPDADRLITAYIEDSKKEKDIKSRGLVYQKLDMGRILVMFTPNQSFLMTFDFQKLALERAGLWKKYDWFILKTTASQISWDQWAKANNVKVINTPVGFKELQDVMMHVERQIIELPGKAVMIEDVFGHKINLAKKPRLLFAGEESGGEIFGPHELIKSKGGKIAISMREKSDGEAILITSALSSWLNQKNLSLTDYLMKIYNENDISARYEIRIDNKYYNESEPDIAKLLQEKEKGIKIRTKNDMFFLSIALSYRDKLIGLNHVQEILSECFPDLYFEDLKDIKFVGDGTFILFSKKCVEVRPSGTDAINKSYSYGSDQWECIKFAKTFSSFEGERTSLHKKYIKEDFYRNVKDYSFYVYNEYKKKM